MRTARARCSHATGRVQNYPGQRAEGSGVLSPSRQKVPYLAFQQLAAVISGASAEHLWSCWDGTRPLQRDPRANGGSCALLVASAIYSTLVPRSKTSWCCTSGGQVFATLLPRSGPL